MELGILTIHDRALQGVVKSALEPEWEARFEKNSYGFRPGRSGHDAIKQIKNVIQNQPNYVLDGDISKCFDEINHAALLQKLGYTGTVRQQIKAWLKSGVIDQGVFTATSEGTMQGGVISPLLANVALHGLEIMLREFSKSIDMKDKNGHQQSRSKKASSLTFIKYADDFLLFHKDLNVVQRCRELISEWLNGMGLELKPSKTRIAHTLIPEQSEDKIAGFDFLGHHIQQFPVSKYKSAKNAQGVTLGFRTLITPSKDACKKHQRKIKDVIKKHKQSHQARLINELNPIIRGWVKYYSNSDAQTTGELTRQDHLIFQKLRAWARYRTGKWNKNTKHKYWITIGNNNWVFAIRQENRNPLRLLTHTEFGSSSTKYVKVRGEDSPFNGKKLVYWSTRMGRNPDMPSRKASLLKRQKGVCPWCCLHFREGDILEEDHVLARALGGKDKYDNLQLLHGHCHDAKTALDLSYIRENSLKLHLKQVNKELDKFDWFWKDDILCIHGKSKGRESH